MIPQNQRSAEWKKWRQTKIGASDASSIMGVNAFRSIGNLLDEKLGIRPIEENAAMARGTALEDEARDAFEALTGHVVFPQVYPHPQHPWMIASLDGMSIERDVVVEIKCPGIEQALKTFRSKKIPVYYFAQLQHQMAVTGLNEIYYFSYYPASEDSAECSILLKQQRDEEYINKLIAREEKFHEILLKAIEEVSKHEDRLFDLRVESFKILENSQW